MVNKGALVIIKRGDKDMRDQMANSIVAPELIKEIDNLKTKYYFAKRRNRKSIMKAIRKARHKYGYNYIPSNKIIKRIREGFALIEYGFAIFVDKFMTIKIGRD